MHAPLFILGLPRSRTAWLSVALSKLGIDMTHDALSDFAGFDGYREDLEARLENGPAGDADPALCFWLSMLLQEWPEARFVIVRQDPDESLIKFCRAAPHHAESIRHGWSSTVSAYKAACDTLRDRATFIELADLSDNVKTLDFLECVTGRELTTLDVERLQRLHVQTDLCRTAQPMAQPPARAVSPIHHLHQIDTSGLFLRTYTSADFAMVAGWWESHNGQAITESALPPTGVVIEHGREPWAAVWVYECFGVAVAELTFPVTKPGLSLKDAARSLLYGCLGAMHVAGKSYDPPASFQTFRCNAPRAMVPFLERIGFVEQTGDKQPMILTL